jgi:hypothetical protein
VTGEVFDPVAAGGDDQVQVTGTGDGESRTVGQADGPTQAGTRRTPVADLLPQYEAQATEALDRAAVAPSVRDLVRAYFDALAGRTP